MLSHSSVHHNGTNELLHCCVIGTSHTHSSVPTASSLFSLLLPCLLDPNPMLIPPGPAVQPPLSVHSCVFFHLGYPFCCPSLPGSSGPLPPPPPPPPPCVPPGPDIHAVCPHALLALLPATLHSGDPFSVCLRPLAPVFPSAHSTQPSFE